MSPKTWIAIVTVFAAVCLNLSQADAQRGDSTSKKASSSLPVSGPDVTGVVNLPTGEPARRATVYLLRNPNGSYTLPTNPLTTTTNENGMFRFESVNPGGHRIWAETEQFTSLAEKFQGQRFRVAKKPPPDAGPLRIDLHAGCGYDVLVRDASTNRPIDGAKISFGWTDIRREYRTEPDGVARIRQLSVGEWYFIIRATGYATEFKRTSKQELGSILPMRFELTQGGSLVGILRDDAGRPIADARVWVSANDTSMAPNFGRLVTDDEGNFSLAGLPVGRPLRLYSRKDGYESGRLECAVGDADVPQHVEMLMKKRPYGGDAIFTVLDHQGLPVRGATLRNPSNSSANLREGVTDAQGRCKMQDLFTRYDGCSVAAKAKGFVAQRVAVEPGTIENPTEITIRLVPGRTLRGQVLKPNGEPAAKLRVYYNRGENGNDLGGRVDTDQRGNFEIDGLPDHSVLTVYTPSTYAPISKIEIPLGGADVDLAGVVRKSRFIRGLVIPEDQNEPVDVKIELQIAAVIRVRAVDATTMTPLPEFNVRLGFCEVRKPEDPRPGGISSSLINPGINVQGTTKEYRLENQLVGTPYKIIVAAKGYERRTIARVVAQAADRAELLDVALKRVNTDDYQTVSGRLLGADGEPISGASVRLLVGGAKPLPVDPAVGRPRMEGWRFYHWGLLSRDDIENRDQCVQLLKAASDSEGRFRFANVKRGTPWMELFYFGDGIMSQRQSNLRDMPDDKLTQLVLRAPRPASVTVRVDRKANANADSLSLEAENYINGPNAVELPYSSESRKLDGDKATVTFDNLPPGNYVVRLYEKPVRSPDGLGFSVKSITQKKLETTPGETTSVSF